MITTEDILEGVKLLWDGNAILTGLVTGGLIFGRVPDGTASPYASLKVAPGEVQLNAGSAYLQQYAIELTTWDESGAAALGPIQRQLEATFSTKGGGQLASRVTLNLPSGRTLQVLHGIKQPGTLDEDAQTQKAQSVKYSFDRFELLCQG